MSEKLDTYGELHAKVNNAVKEATGRSVSVIAARLMRDGTPVVSALTSRADGSMVRVIVKVSTGERLDSEGGTIARDMADALAEITPATMTAYYDAWHAVFASEDK